MKHLSVPHSPSDVTAEWLTHVLSHSGLLSSGQRVTAVRYEEAVGGLAVTGCVTRLAFEVEPGHPPVPGTLFAKLRNPNWGGDASEYRLENRFYRDLLDWKSGCPDATTRPLRAGSS